LDLSKNNISEAGQLGLLVELKILNLENNNLYSGSLESLSKLKKLQNLSVAGNKLGNVAPSKATVSSHRAGGEPLPALPCTLKHLNLAANVLSYVPRSVVSESLNKLEKLDLSSNQLATVPNEICNLTNLEELRLDSNMIVSLPDSIGRLSKLKVLSLRDNMIQYSKGFLETGGSQPLPKALFTDTSLIDLNLHGNQLTNTQMNQFEGYQDFLDRRQKVKSKTMTNFDVCGLD
jgi:Leucine-rich repeat (LRR) protein